MVNELAHFLLEHKAVEIGDFTLASGRKSRFYVDVKTSATRPEFLSRIAREVSKKAEFDLVAGVAVGAVPLAVAVSLESGRPYAIIRPSEKTHGKSGVIIGDVSQKKVLLVEDVTTSGGSALFGVRSLRSAGAVIDTVIVVVDREEGALPALEKEGVRLVPLVTLKDLIPERPGTGTEKRETG